MCRTVSRPRCPRFGFTLVELLTVIVIIGILASLITAAVIAARNRARETAIRMEMGQLQMALETYKNEVGEYPPDFSNINDADATIRDAARAHLLRHIVKAFPGYNGSIDDFMDSLDDYGLADASGATPFRRIYLDQASALIFWLGGLPEAAGSGLPAGFHTNPQNPFQTGRPRDGKRFDFDEDRYQFDVSNTEGRLRYYVTDRFPNTGPYVYFRPRRASNDRLEYGFVNTAGVLQPFACVLGTESVAVPYLDGNATVANPNDVSATRVWRNPEKYQILTPGLDGIFGHSGSTTFDASNNAWYRFSRTGLHLTEGDMDNQADFSEGTLETEMKK